MDRAHSLLERARDRFARAEERLKDAEHRVERALARAAAELENRAIYAADGANESTSSEVNLMTAAAVAIMPPSPEKTPPARATGAKAAPARAKPAAKPRPS